MTLGERNNNPLNIRKVPGVRWRGEILPLKGAGGSFVRFESIEWGVRAALKLLRTYRDKYAATSIKEIITRWAPPIENKTDDYIAAVCRLTSFGAGERLTEKEWPALIKAMAVIESRLLISDETIDAARKLLQRVKNEKLITEVSEVKMEVKMEVNSLRSWELKWTIPYRLSASKAIVQHAVLNFQPAKQA